MKTPTNNEVQIITQGGKPAFAVVPYDQWLELSNQGGDAYIPHEVVGIQLKSDCSLIAAWRKYKKLTQAELARRMGVTQAALSQLEKQGSNPQAGTLQKVAAALEIEVNQLTE